MDLSALAGIDLEAIPDAGARTAIRGLLNLVEQLAAENRALRDAVQRLRDAVQRLRDAVQRLRDAVQRLRDAVQRLRDTLARAQGEQGQPRIKANTPPPPAPRRGIDYSSQAQR